MRGRRPRPGAKKGEAEGGKEIAAVPRPLAISTPRAILAAPLEIRPVHGRADLKRFLNVPWRIYAADPQWVPPLLMDVKEFLNRRKHPFYQHGDATQLLAVRGEETVGRMLVSDDPLYNQQHGENLGCFGMFECVDDPPAAQALLDAAADWLRARGRTAIRGPIDYSMNYPCGLLVDGFDTPPRIMMNHNRPYYAGLLESWGLRKTKDLYAWWFVDPLDLVAKWKLRAERLARRGGVTVRPFRTNDFTAEVARCHAVYNGAMGDLWGFVKLTPAEFQYLAKRLEQLAIADQVLLAEAKGEVVGFSITLPDINEAIRPLNGRLTRFGVPWGLLQLLRRKRHIRTARMVVLDVLEGISPPGHRRTADPPHARLRQKRHRLHRSRVGLDAGGQRRRQSHDRSGRRPPLQDLPDLPERHLIVPNETAPGFAALAMS